MMNLIENKKNFKELINTLEKKIETCSRDKDDFRKLTKEYSLIMNDNFDILQESNCTQYIDYHKFIDGYIESSDFQKAKNQLKADLTFVKSLIP